MGNVYTTKAYQAVMPSIHTLPYLSATRPVLSYLLICGTLSLSKLPNHIRTLQEIPSQSWQYVEFSFDAGNNIIYMLLADYYLANTPRRTDYAFQCQHQITRHTCLKNLGTDNESCNFPTQSYPPCRKVIEMNGWVISTIIDSCKTYFASRTFVFLEILSTLGAHDAIIVYSEIGITRGKKMVNLKHSFKFERKSIPPYRLLEVSGSESNISYITIKPSPPNRNPALIH